VVEWSNGRPRARIAQEKRKRQKPKDQPPTGKKARKWGEDVPCRR
jgi:hypothetical protein